MKKPAIDGEGYFQMSHWLGGILITVKGYQRRNLCLGCSHFRCLWSHVWRSKYCKNQLGWEFATLILVAGETLRKPPVCLKHTVTSREDQPKTECHISAFIFVSVSLSVGTSMWSSVAFVRTFSELGQLRRLRFAGVFIECCEAKMIKSCPATRGGGTKTFCMLEQPDVVITQYLNTLQLLLQFFYFSLLLFHFNLLWLQLCHLC